MCKQRLWGTDGLMVIKSVHNKSGGQRVMHPAFLKTLKGVIGEGLKVTQCMEVLAIGCELI